MNADPRRAARRFEQRLAVLSLLGVVSVAGAVVATSGDEVSALARGDSAAELRRAVADLYDPLPQEGRVLGVRGAPVTMTVFADLQSTEARRLVLGPLRTMVGRRVTAGQMRVRLRSMRQVTPRTPVFLAQQSAALAAARQGRMWQYVVLFLRQQSDPGSGYVDQRFLRGVARQAGLDLERFDRDRADPELRRQVSLSSRTARGMRRAGPVVLIRGPGGRQVAGGVGDRRALERLYDRVRR